MSEGLTETTALTESMDEPTHYAFPIRYDHRWQGGAITDTLAKALIVCGQSQDKADVEAEVYVTLAPDAYAQWVAEWTTPDDHRWPTLWGRVRVQESRINAVWLPIAWLPTQLGRMPGRGSAPRLQEGRALNHG